MLLDHQTKLTINKQQTKTNRVQAKGARKVAPYASKEMLVQRIQSNRHYQVQRQADTRELQRLVGANAATQLLAKSEQPAEVQTKAAGGVQGAGSPLPHLDKIQPSFGQHDVSHVQAFTNVQAKEACTSINAEGYAMGDKVAFNQSNPSLHTAAHEAAHVIQQQHGVQLKGGVGEAGDQYERHADEVADAVVQGKSAEELLAPYTTTSSSKPATQMQAVQRVVKFKGASISGTSDLSNKKLPGGGKMISYIVAELQKIDATIDITKVNGYLNEIILNDPYHIHNFKGGSNIIVANKFVAYLKERHAKPLLDAKDPLQFSYFLHNLLTGDRSLKERTDLQTIEVVNKPSSEYRLSRFMDFLPAKNKKVPNQEFYEPNFDLDKFKTKLNDDNVTHAGNVEGFGAELITPMNVIHNRLRTSVTWQGAEDGLFGVEMKALRLGPDHKLGTEPSSTGAHVTARKALTTISDDKYIAGHLLNEQLGGPGNDVRNLAPIPDYSNKIHERRVENEVKYLVNREHLWIWYHVEAPTAEINEDKFDAVTNKLDKGDSEDIKQSTAMKNAYDDVKGKYTRAFIMEWGLLDNNGGKLTGLSGGLPDTRRTLTLNFPDPIELRQYLHGGRDKKPIVNEIDTSATMSQAALIKTIKDNKNSTVKLDIENILTVIAALPEDELIKLIEDSPKSKRYANRMMEELDSTAIHAIFNDDAKQTNLTRIADATEFMNWFSANKLRKLFGTSKRLMRVFTRSQLEKIFTDDDTREDLIKEGLYGTAEENKPTNAKLNSPKLTDLTTTFGISGKTIGRAYINLNKYDMLLIKEDKLKAQLQSLDTFIPHIIGFKNQLALIFTIMNTDFDGDLKNLTELKDFTDHYDKEFTKLKENTNDGINHLNDGGKWVDGLKNYETALRNKIIELLPKIKIELYNKVESTNPIIKEQPSSDIIIKAYIDKYIDSILLKKQQERLDQLTDVRQQVITLQTQLNKIQRTMIISLLETLANSGGANLKKWLEDNASDPSIVAQTNIIIDHVATPVTLKHAFYTAVGDDSTDLGKIYSTSTTARGKKLLELK